MRSRTARPGTCWSPSGVERQHRDPGRPAVERTVLDEHVGAAIGSGDHERVGVEPAGGGGQRPEAGRVEPVPAGRGLPPCPDRHEPARAVGRSGRAASRSPRLHHRAQERPTSRGSGPLPAAPAPGPRARRRRRGRAGGRQHPRRELGRLPRRLVAGRAPSRVGPPRSPSGRARGPARPVPPCRARPPARRCPRPSPTGTPATKTPAPEPTPLAPVPQGPHPERRMTCLRRVHESVRRQVEHARPRRRRARPASSTGRRGRRGSAAGRQAPARRASAGTPPARRCRSAQPSRPCDQAVGPGRTGPARTACTGASEHPVDDARGGGGHHEVVDGGDDAER